MLVVGSERLATRTFDAHIVRGAAAIENGPAETRPAEGLDSVTVEPIVYVARANPDAAHERKAMNPFRKYLTLTATLVLFLFVLTPLRAAFGLGGIWSQMLFTGVLVASLAAVPGPRTARTTAIGLAAASLLAGILSLNRAGDFWIATELILSIAFLGLTTVLLIVAVARAPRVSADVISGSIAAYLLIALTFSLAYALCFHLAPSSITTSSVIFGNSHAGAYTGLSDPRTGALAYFSFVTLTTLGYGDIAPAAPFTASLAAFEAVVGQIYLTVLVARLVGLHLTNDSR